MVDTIEVRGVTYDVERRTNADGDDVLTVDAFPGIEAYLGLDPEPEWANPREFDNVGTMAVSYRNYRLGDEDLADVDLGDVEGDPATALVEHFMAERGATVVIGLTVYEHSGITMRAGNVGFAEDPQGWDTSFVGFIFDTPEGRALMGPDVTHEDITAALKGEVELYAAWLEGDVTCWRVEDPETGFMEGCGGYLADREHMESECVSALADAIAGRLDELAERAEMEARGVVTR